MGDNYLWVQSSTNRDVPPNAVVGGRDKEGSPIYVGRAHHAGDLIPAKIIPDKKIAQVGYGGREFLVNNYEVLCEKKFKWIPGSKGLVPKGAVPAGYAVHNEILYIGRTNHAGAQIVGKVHPTQRCLYFGYEGSELWHSNYEILILE